MRVHLSIALMKYLPILLQHIHLQSFVLRKKEGTNQYVYKLMQSHESLDTLIYYYCTSIRWSGNFYLAQKRKSIQLQQWRLVVKLAGRAAKFHLWLNIWNCRHGCFCN